MRRVTRNVVVAILVALAALLALGALPSYLESGDPYYVTATPIDEGESLPDTVEPFNATVLPERRFPYTTGALASAGPNRTGRSEPYFKGPFGYKGAFTHSPFDEFDALARRYPNATVTDEKRAAGAATVAAETTATDDVTATDDTVIYATYNGTHYRLEIVHEDQ